VWGCGGVGVWACGRVGVSGCGGVGVWGCGDVGVCGWVSGEMGWVKGERSNLRYKTERAIVRAPFCAANRSAHTSARSALRCKAERACAHIS
jgi:hypothetical protein